MHLLAIDQGTTSSRAIVFSRDGAMLGVGQQEFEQFYPQDGWVEHDAGEIWSSTLEVCRAALEAASVTASDIAGIGITNQRETTVVWDRETGEPVHRAIVWQDRRTADFCDTLRDEGFDQEIAARTGLVVDAYFSATKLRWILDNVDGARERAAAGELLFGTVDTWLLWHLTGGTVHATDATNASRTMLFNIHEQAWDDALLARFDVPRAMLPEVRDSSADYGQTTAGLFGEPIRIGGIAGDQQAALFGQACFEPGMIKSTYGTGCFAMVNTGSTAAASGNQLLTTVAYRLGGEVTYALEGSIFVAGAAVKWLRDKLGIIDSAAATEAMAQAAPADSGVFLVPAFTGLGAPYWDPDARGALFGMTLDTDASDIARAALESVCLQTRDLTDAMVSDGATIDRLRVDGGMVVNDFLLQMLADTVGVGIDRLRVAETTALGAAYLAGLAVGVYSGLDEIGTQWAVDAAFEPATGADGRDARYAQWQEAVRRVRTRG